VQGVAPAPLAEAKAHPLWAKFWAQVADDLNSPRALAVAWETAKDDSLASALKAGLIAAMDAWLGLDLLAADAQLLLNPDEQALVDARIAARNGKDFKESDHLRDELAKRGLQVKDTKDGQVVSRVNQLGG